MKKIISSVLCLVMLFSLSIPASALIVDSSDSTGQSNDFVLTYSNEANYEITIPASGTVDKTTGKGTITINIGEVNLEDGTAISVTATSTNYDDSTWHLVNVKDSSDRIGYLIYGANGEDIADGSVVLKSSVPTSITLDVIVENTNKVGTFTDTITFTSEIVSALISFTVDGVSYQAVEGVTWGEWLESNYNTSSNFSLSGTTVTYNGDNVYWANISAGVPNQLVKSTDKIMAIGHYSYA